MSFTDKLESAGYELIAPEKKELLNDSKILDNKINNSSPLEKSITKLIEKIDNSKTGEERYILNQQLDELKKIDILYKQSNKKNITKKSSQEINKLLLSVEGQININENLLENDSNKLKNIIEKETDRLQDTIDILTPNTIRDTIESNIDIKGINESIGKKEYQAFFDIATITYINFIENNIIQRQLNSKEEKGLVNNDGLFLNKKEAQIYINNLYKKLLENKILPNFSFNIKLKKYDYEQSFTIDLKEYDKKNKLNKYKIKENKRLKQERIDKKNKIQKFEENMKPLSTKERMQYIEKILDEKEFTPYLISVINKMEGKTIYLQKNKQVKLDKKYIIENKKELLNNFKSLVLFIIEMESNGYSKAQNPDSTAEGLGQWLSGNGEFATEYMYNKKWHSTKIKGKKYSTERTTWHTSSFETTLRNIRRKYPDELIKELSFIPNRFNKKINLRPINLTLRSQIKLLILDLGSNTKKVRNQVGNLLGIQDYLGTVILGNKWATKEIYKIFHHTRPDKKTLNRINKIISKYENNINKIV